jgi:hypothetical protein
MLSPIIFLILLVAVGAFSILPPSKLTWAMGSISVIGIILVILGGAGIFTGWDTPSGARSFAYEHMIQKNNVTISGKFAQSFDETTLWITDTKGTNYRVQNFWLWNSMKINHTYNIKYTRGNFNMIWEAEEIQKETHMIIALNTGKITIPKGRCVYISGSLGKYPTIGISQANDTNTLPAIGIAVESITNGSFGKIFRVDIKC